MFLCSLYFNILLTSFFFNVCLFFFFFLIKIISYSLRTIVSLEIIGFQFTKIYYHFCFMQTKFTYNLDTNLFFSYFFLTGLKNVKKEKKDNFTHYKTCLKTIQNLINKYLLIFSCEGNWARQQNKRIGINL